LSAPTRRSSDLTQLGNLSGESVSAEGPGVEETRGQGIGCFLPDSECGAVELLDVAVPEDRIKAGQAENGGTLRHRRLGESAAQRHGRLHRIDPTGQQDVDRLVQSSLNERGE